MAKHDKPAWKDGKAPLSRCAVPARTVNRLGLEGADKPRKMRKLIGPAALLATAVALAVVFRGDIEELFSRPDVQTAEQDTELIETPLEMRIDAHPGEEIGMEIDGGQARPFITEGEAIEKFSETPTGNDEKETVSLQARIKQ